MAQISEDDLRAIFNSFDADGSGSISASELLNALKKVFGDEKSEEDIKALAGAILNEADTDNDKKITWDEFKAAATSP